MPCYSRIATKMTVGDHIASAMRALGYTVNNDGAVITGEKAGRRIVFRQGSPAYTVQGDTSDLAAITRGYAETGVRAFAKKRGYTVEKAGSKLVLTNRRG
jgi:hypothetical protein